MRILCNKEIISDDFQKISEAIQCVIKHQNSQPNLREIAHSIGLNLRYFQSMFRRWVGVSPEEFLKHVTIDNAREHLKTSANIIDLAFKVRLSRPGHLSNLFTTIQAVDPFELKSRGSGL